MLDSAPTKRPIPFYASYASFLRALKALKEHGVPRRITTKALQPLLGDDAVRISAGLTSIGWCDENGFPTEPFNKLVSAFGTDSWKSTLAEVVPATYDFITDWEELTPSKLRDAFVQHAGRDAEAIRSAETFFLCIATEGGLRIPDIFDRRIIKQIADARRSISAVGNSNPAIKPPKPPASQKEVVSTKSGNQWVDHILNLTALLNDEDITGKEKDAVVTLLSYFARRGQRGA